MRFAVLDTETTGFMEQEDARVVEVGVAVFEHDSYDPVATYTSFVKPDILTEEGRDVVMRISHIDPDVLLDAPSYQTVMEQMLFVISDAPVIAYNLPFDRAMILRSMDCPQIFTREFLIGEMFAGRKEANCAMEGFLSRFSLMSRTREDGQKSYFPLRRAIAIAGISFEGQAHRALTDAVATGRLVVELLAGLCQPELPASRKVKPTTPAQAAAVACAPIRPCFIKPSPIIRPTFTSSSPKIVPRSAC